MCTSSHSALPTPHSFAVSVVERLQSAGHVAMFAGGCVRDMLLARSGTSEPDDYDVATDATPQRVRELFGKRQTLAVGEAFGVIIVLGPKVNLPHGEQRHLQVEVATFRAEGTYSDGRRPDHVVFCTAAEDAARRDFTINGMFYNPIEDQVADYVGGQQDLEAGVVRAIGDPHARIAEDKLRMLRAVRFTARFGFTLDHETRHAVEQHAPEITVVSWERITQELTKILTHRSRADGVGLLADVGLLDRVLPELAQTHSNGDGPLPLARRVLERLSSPSFTTALTALLRLDSAKSVQDRSKIVDGIGRRLKLSNSDRQSLQWLTEHRGFVRTFCSHTLAEQKVVLSNEHACDVIELDRSEAGAEGDAEALSQIETAERFFEDTPAEVLDPPPLLTGNDLVAIGLEPGREFKTILETIRNRQLNEEISSREDAIAYVQSR